MTSPLMETVRNRLSGAFAALVSFASRMSPARLAWGGLALAAVMLLSVNLISSELFGGWKADLTEDRLFTISPGSAAVLGAIEEPIKAQLYFSSKLGERAPSLAAYSGRIRTMLEEFQRLSNGKFQLEVVDPQPFTEVEEKAVGAGLRGQRLNAEGEMGYFGLVATNATDDQQVIASLSPDRENFVEYDITKLIHSLSNPKKRLVGLISSLPLDGGENPMTKQPTQPWIIMSQIREFFDVETLDQAVTEIPARIDVLLVAKPTMLTPQAAYAIDQFALKGGKLLVLVDPMAEAAQLELLQKKGEGNEQIAALLKSWGVEFDGKKVAADIRHARRVQFGRGEEGSVTQYVAWLGLDKSNFDPGDILSSGIETLNVASPGILTPIEGATTRVTPLLTTSSDAMEIKTEQVGMSADPVALLRNYVPGGKKLDLAVRISGDAKSAFPAGAPKPGEKAGDKKDNPAAAPDAKPADATNKADEAKPAAPATPGPGHVATGRINAIVVADTDFLADRFWVENRDMLGQQFVVPSAGNGAFVVGALENLTGSDALLALRGRGIKNRTFTLVENLRLDAERQYREKEEALTAKLKSVEAELQKLQTAAATNNIIADEQKTAAIERFTSQMIETRRELRQVKLALGQSITSLDGWLKFANIALVPLLIAAGGIGWSVWRARRAGPKA
ncbi:GldG family protein [Hyphomicrobium sp.]|uniref:GldG family protein n=1 Tax=Hyphomicrobium sp. TaxID=82 RepID=UPI003F6F29EA